MTLFVGRLMHLESRDPSPSIKRSSAGDFFNAWDTAQLLLLLLVCSRGSPPPTERGFDCVYTLSLDYSLSSRSSP
jgi:hypothetical protein